MNIPTREELVRFAYITDQMSRLTQAVPILAHDPHDPDGKSKAIKAMKKIKAVMAEDGISETEANRICDADTLIRYARKAGLKVVEQEA